MKIIIFVILCVAVVHAKLHLGLTEIEEFIAECLKENDLDPTTFNGDNRKEQDPIKACNYISCVHKNMGVMKQDGTHDIEAILSIPKTPKDKLEAKRVLDENFKFCRSLAKPVLLGINNLPHIHVIHCVCQIIFNLASLVILTKSVGATIAESKKTGIIVNECVGCLQNLDIISQLNQFSNYLLHKSINFTAFNLFTLDESLLMSIASSITTYLVILLQFKESSISSKS